MRIAYLDESGISNIRHEPYMVVAGILIHADRDWHRLHAKLAKVATKYSVSTFDFHAKDIFHGSGVFDRKKAEWPVERRRALLLELASIPSKFNLPVVFGFINRTSYKSLFEEHVRGIRRIIPDAMKTAAADDLAFLEAFVGAARGVDYWLMQNSKKENAIIIFEDSPRSKDDVKFLQAVFRAKEDIHLTFLRARKFKSRHVIETVHFARKKDSALLQIADICAFVIKRQLMKRADTVDFYKAIEPQLVRTRPTKVDTEMDSEEMRRAMQWRLAEESRKLE